MKTFEQWWAETEPTEQRLLVEQAWVAARAELLVGPWREVRVRVFQTYFHYLLRQTGGDMKRACALAGLNRTSVYRRLHQIGVDWKQLRNTADEQDRSDTPASTT